MINQNLQILLTFNPPQAHVHKFLNFVLHQEEDNEYQSLFTQEPFQTCLLSSSNKNIMHIAKIIVG